MKIKQIFLANILLGLITFSGVVCYVRYFSTSSENVKYVSLLPGIFSVISSLICSKHYNKEVAFPLYHPIFLFFRIIFSKATLVPALFFPVGSVIGHFTIGYFITKSTFFVTIKAGVLVALFLYFFGIVGSFLGILLLDSKLNPK